MLDACLVDTYGNGQSKTTTGRFVSATNHTMPGRGCCLRKSWCYSPSLMILLIHMAHWKRFASSTKQFKGMISFLKSKKYLDTVMLTRIREPRLNSMAYVLLPPFRNVDRLTFLSQV